MKNSIVCCNKRLNIEITEYDSNGVKAIVKGSSRGKSDTFNVALNTSISRLAKLIVSNAAELLMNKYQEALPTDSIAYSYQIESIEDQTAVVSIQYSPYCARLLSGCFKGKKAEADRLRDYITDELEAKVESKIKELQEKAENYNAMGLYIDIPEVLRFSPYEISGEILAAGTVKGVEDRLEAYISEHMETIAIFEEGMCFFNARKAFLVEDGKIKQMSLYEFAHSLDLKLYVRCRESSLEDFKFEEVTSEKDKVGYKKPIYYLVKMVFDMKSGKAVEKLEKISSGRVFYNGSIIIPNFMLSSDVTSKLKNDLTEEQFLEILEHNITEKKKRWELLGSTRKKKVSGVQEVSIASGNATYKLVRRALGVGLLQGKDKEFADMLMEKPRICKVNTVPGERPLVKITFILRRFWYTQDEFVERVKENKENFDKCVAFAILTQPFCKELGGIADFDISSKIVGGNKLVYELLKKPE